LERVYLAAVLEATGGKVGEAASRAGLNPRTLYDKMKKYGLIKETFGRDERSGSNGQRGAE
jgi:DNA-binding NtrC family response regulator